MLRTFAAAATAAALALPAFAQDDMSSGEDQMTMLRDQLRTVLADCNQVNEDEVIDQLTLAQVSGIVLRGTSSDSTDECQEIEAILND